MDLPEFALERWFARLEFSTPLNLCASGVEAMGLGELLSLADEECRGLWDALSLGDTESAGHPLLREEVAGLWSPPGAGPSTSTECARPCARKRASWW